MSLHRLYLPTPASPALTPGDLLITGEEAKHAARVKRIEPGDPLEVLDGRGHIGLATLASIDKDRGEWRLRLTVSTVRHADPVSPQIDILSPAPKGPRLADLIDSLSQAGAASWAPLETDFTQGDPRDTRLERLERTAAEASKQCGRAWLLQIAPRTPFAAALSRQPVVIADASGAHYTPTRSPRITLLVGPEGGWSPRELALARTAGATPVSFGPHVMRIETAAAIATSIVLDTESRAR